MCKLKHLAVAAAIIGLATQVQAGYFAGSTDFEGANPLADGLWSDVGDAEIATAAINANLRPENRPSFFANTVTNVLAVDNDPPITRNLNDQGAAQSVGDGIYAEALISGTPLAFEANTPTNSSGDKILVYTRVNQGGTETNLCVLAAGSAAGGQPEEFRLVNTRIGKDDWHRVTISAKANGAYQIYLDGTLCTAAGDKDTFYAITAGDTVTSLAFKGSGFVDDLVLSNLDPAQIVHNLVWGEGFGSVSYTVDGAPGESLENATSPYAFQAPAGSEIILTGDTGYRTFAATNTIGASSISLALPSVTGIAKYFPQTATADQDGTVAHPFEIADVGDLLALQAAVQATNCAGICFVQVADIEFAGEATFAGIGTYVETSPSDGKPFSGIYDGQNYTISNVAFTDRPYAGIFNQVNGGTIKNLMVENLFFVGTGEKYSASIIGNAGNGATLQNLVAKGVFGSFGKPGNHNMAGIAIRLSGGGGGTLVKDCTNNAAIYGTYTKMAGICAITQVKVSGGPVTFEGCCNNGNLIMPSGGTAGRDGLAGIVGYVDDDTVLKDCANTTYGDSAFSTVLATAKIGQLVGWAHSHSLTDLGGNSAFYVRKMVADYNSACTITNFQYATVSGGMATTVTTLSANNGYLLERDVVASETPVFTLQDAGDRISFDTTIGTNNYYSFNGTIDAVAPWVVEVSTNDYVITYTAVSSGGTYAAGDEVDGTYLSADMARWLNIKKGAATKADFESRFDNDGLSLDDEFLFNTDPTVATTVSFAISDIAVSNSAVSNTVVLQVSLIRTENNAAVTDPIYGVLGIIGGQSVDRLNDWEMTLRDSKFSGGAPATATLTTNNKFFKALILMRAP